MQYEKPPARRSPGPLAVLCGLLFASTAESAPLAQQSDELAARYGFCDFEIYKFSNGIFDLRSGDLDGDGLTDLVLVDNARSRIERLLRIPADQPDEFGEDAVFAEDTANPIQFDGRFRRRKLSVEQRILQMDVGDFDRDGCTDIAYVTPGRLLIAFSACAGKEEWTREIAVDELREGCDLLAAADLDGDGTDDLALAGGNALLWIRSISRAGLSHAQTLDHVAGGLDAITASDFDGDGHKDLLLTYLDDDRPYALRLALPGGGFGPRIELRRPRLRSFSARDLEGDGRVELLGVLKLSGRLVASRLERAVDGKRALARYALGPRPSNAEKRGMALGDLDGDGLTDAVATIPEAARVSAFLAQEGGFSVGEFPSLVAAGDPRIADFDGDGRAELVVRSGPERVVGISRMDDAKKLPFPDTYPLSGEPIALDAADMNGDGRADVVAIVSSGEGRSRTYSLEILFGGESGLADGRTVQELGHLKKAPDGVVAVDLDGNRSRDLLAFFPGEGELPSVWLQRDGAFQADERGDDTPGMGILKGAARSNVAIADVDGDQRVELLVCSGNLARGLRLAHQGEQAEAVLPEVPEVVEQYNGRPDSLLVGAIPADLDGDGVAEIVLADDRFHELLVHTRSGSGGLELAERIEYTGLDYAGLSAADLDGDGAADLVVFGEDGFGVLYSRDDAWDQVEVGSYDPVKERLFLDTIAAGDMDGDGARDVLVSELGENAVVVLRPALEAPADRLRHALSFKVFEQKTFADSQPTREPRELLVADVTGDGKDDLALLAHDKLIVYIQE